jgi:hypothetical protein
MVSTATVMLNWLWTSWLLPCYGFLSRGQQPQPLAWHAHNRLVLLGPYFLLQYIYICTMYTLLLKERQDVFRKDHYMHKIIITMLDGIGISLYLYAAWTYTDFLKSFFEDNMLPFPVKSLIILLCTDVHTIWDNSTSYEE